MLYANFSSNFPTGLQNFEFVDLTIITCKASLAKINMGPYHEQQQGCLEILTKEFAPTLSIMDLSADKSLNAIQKVYGLW